MKAHAIETHMPLKHNKQLSQVLQERSQMLAEAVVHYLAAAMQ